MLACLVAKVWASKIVLVCGIRKQPGFFRQNISDGNFQLCRSTENDHHGKEGYEEDCEADIPKVYRLGFGCRDLHANSHRDFVRKRASLLMATLTSKTALVRASTKREDRIRL